MVEKSFEYYRKKHENFIGRGLADHENKKFWINIPKNASNSIIDYLCRQNKWVVDNYNKKPEIQSYTKYVYLRDPIERWCRCTLELCWHHYLLAERKTDDFVEWFEKKDFKNFQVFLDMHHLRQVDYMYGMNMENVLFCHMGKEKFEERTYEMFGLEGDIKYLNPSNSNETKQIFLPHVLELLKDENFVYKLRNFYQADYDLIEELAKKG